MSLVLAALAAFVACAAIVTGSTATAGAAIAFATIGMIVERWEARGDPLVNGAMWDELENREDAT